MVCTGHDGTVRSVAFLAPSFSQPKNRWDVALCSLQLAQLIEKPMIHPSNPTSCIPFCAVISAMMDSVGSTHLSSAGSGDCAVRIFDVALAVSRTGNRQQRGPASAPRLATDQICVPLQILSNGVHRAPVFALSAGATPNELFSVRCLGSHAFGPLCVFALFFWHVCCCSSVHVADVCVCPTLRLLAGVRRWHCEAMGSACQLCCVDFLVWCTSVRC